MKIANHVDKKNFEKKNVIPVEIKIVKPIEVKTVETTIVNPVEKTVETSFYNVDKCQTNIVPEREGIRTSETTMTVKTKKVIPVENRIDRMHIVNNVN